MTVLLDANVLIALAIEDHVHHAAAARWFVAWSGSFASCPSTQGRLLHDRHEFWPDDLPYRLVRMNGVVGHRQVTDAYLAGLARARGGRLATFDAGLTAMHPDVADQVPTT